MAKNLSKYSLKLFLIAAITVSGAFALSADLNEDGKIDLSDILQIASKLGTAPEGTPEDLNYDRKVNLIDITLAARMVGTNTTPSPPPPSDTTPPTATINTPTNNQQFQAGTTQTTLSVTTNEAATCRWSTTNQAYSSMSSSNTLTGSTIHTATITGLANGQSYTRYVRCIDTAGNAMTNSATVTFSVANTQTTPPPGGLLSISSIVQSFNTTGQGVVSSGFPLREGDLRESDITNNLVCVFVNGVEQSTYIEALGGRFQDGTVRSMLIQFQYNIPNNNPINAEVRIGTTCNAPHISKTPVSAQVYLDARVILPSDPAYLSATWVTFQPILPAASEDSVAKAYFTTFLDYQFENGFPFSWHQNAVPGKNYELTSGSYQATYESTRSLFAAWQKTGDTKYYYNAYQRAWYQLTKYSLPVKGYGYSPDPNPNGLPGNGGGLTSEWNSQRYVGLASAYLITGLEEYRNSIALTASWKYGGIDTKAKATDPNSGWIDNGYPGRFNIISTWAAGLTTLIDASQAYSGGAGGYGPRQTVTNPDVRLPWILDAWEMNTFAKGDFRDGLVGTSPTATNGGTAAPGDIPLFQVALLGDYLIFYYTNIQADPRIPGWVQTMADIAIGQTVPLQSGDTCYGTGPVWGYNYNLGSTQGRLGAVAPYTLPMWSSVFAFTYAQTGDTKYLTWYQRAADKRNVEPGYCLYWAWKYWGESFGNTMSAPYYAQIGLPQNLPQTIRIPPPPGTAPVASQ